MTIQGGVTRDQLWAAQAKVMKEDELQAKIIELAERFGYLWYHVTDSRRDPAGFPDLVLVSTRRFLMRELKRQHEDPKPKQVTWLTTLEKAGVNVGVWRPLDLLNRTIERELAK